jgi:class 3 adenylate cyclase
MPELPSGTVTFLFSDIEGSTSLLRELGDAYAGALAEHRSVFRAAFAEHGGVEVDTQGDAFFAAFVRASDAVAAAAEIQSRLAPDRSASASVHTGELRSRTRATSASTHRGARVCAAGRRARYCSPETTRPRRRGGLRSR